MSHFVQCVGVAALDGPYLTTGQAARRLGIAKGTLLRAVRCGAITPTATTPGGYLRFRDDDVEAYARQLASMAPQAVPRRRKRSLVTLHTSESRLALQYAATTVLALSVTLDDAVPRLLETIGVHLGWDVGAFWQVDRQATVLRCRARWQRPSIDSATFVTLSEQMAFAPGVGLPGRVWASGRPALISNVAHDTNFPRTAQAGAAGIHGAVCFPILMGTAVHSVVEFFSHDIGTLDTGLVQALTTLGTQIGGFIERTQAEDARRMSEARKAAMLETALDAIVTMDHEGRIVEFNPMAEQIFGYSRGAALGRELAELIVPPGLREQHRAGLKRYLAIGEGPLIGRRMEVMAQRADGSCFPAEVAITRIPLSGPPFFTGYIRDISARVQAEDAVRASEDRFRATFEQAAVGIAHVGLDGRWLRVNDKLCAILGYTRDELLRRAFQDVTHPDDLDGDLAHVGRLIAGEIPTYDMEKRYVHKDGSIVWANLTVALVRTPRGEPHYFISVVEDISARRRTEEALRASEERLRTVAANAPVILFTLDRHGVVTFATGQGLVALGLQPSQMVGVSVFDLYPDVPDTLEHVRRALAGDAFAAIDRLGEAVFETHWLPLRDQHGSPDGVIGVATNITERQQLEQRTHTALNALLAMAEASVMNAEQTGMADGGAASGHLAELARQVLGCRHAAIIAVEPEIEVLRPLAIAGFSPAEARHWWGQWELHPHLRERLDAAYIAQLEAEQTFILNGTHILDGTQPPFPPDTALGCRDVLVVPLRVGAGLSGILLVDHGAEEHTYSPDEIALARAAGRLVALIIERERLLEDRATAQANALALREANRRMEEFLSIAGHELRTPLTSVIGNVQLAAKWIDMVQQGPAESLHEPFGRLVQVQTVLRRMERQGRVLSRLVDDLLDTSRIQLGRLTLRPTLCDLAALVRDTVQESKQQAPWRNIRIDIPASAVCVLADAERIAQVLANYLSNALKYSAVDQPVTVGLCLEQAEARAWVRDSGPGLPAGEHERVWDRFYRVAEIAHRDGSSLGLGLGLYISRTIIERHGGRVGVESAPGAGATFWFTLPLAQQGDGEP